MPNHYHWVLCETGHVASGAPAKQGAVKRETCPQPTHPLSGGGGEEGVVGSRIGGPAEWRHIGETNLKASLVRCGSELHADACRRSGGAGCVLLLHDVSTRPRGGFSAEGRSRAHVNSDTTPNRLFMRYVDVRLANMPEVRMYEAPTRSEAERQTHQRLA